MFSCKIAHYGKSLISVFQEFSASITKLSFWKEDWALGYHFMKFRHFPVEETGSEIFILDEDDSNDELITVEEI